MAWKFTQYFESVMKTEDEVDALIQGEHGASAPDLLRRFACECSRRVMHLYVHPICQKLLEFAERRVAGELNRDELEQLRREAGRMGVALDPGDGSSPSADSMAFGSACESALTENALTAATFGSNGAAYAVAIATADAVDDVCYDIVYEAAFQHERKAQLELLKRLISERGKS